MKPSPCPTFLNEIWHRARLFFCPHSMGKWFYWTSLFARNRRIGRLVLGVRPIVAECGPRDMAGSGIFLAGMGLEVAAIVGQQTTGSEVE